MIQNVYQGRETFEYLVLPAFPSRSVTPPRTLFSSIPPHLTLSYTLDKVLRRYEKWHDSILKRFRGTAISGATFQLTRDIFANLYFVHRCWLFVLIPPRFLGLQDVALWEGNMDISWEDSDDDTGSSTMDWVPTFSDEPQRRLRQDELRKDPVIVWPRAVANEDAISWDSHITGVEDPDEYAKASMARGDYSEDQAWLEGVENWVENASGDINEQGLLNDAQIEGDEEPPRAASSIDLDKPDYLWRLALRASVS
ncbi:hypothetical protein FB45DRAFT_316256 [Roridomyces roridus]|uniref:Uncharacterized protein n=1 Tax=Roridomyces roridus TaxID=1738132 RepID=A0AAD7B6V2_9AGAR|nr:hypothetical protein FB45DRAFT_316256 [Roridomyces roridus]